MNKYNQIIYIGNDWGNFVDIEKYKYDINSRPLPLIYKPICNYSDINCNINCNIGINDNNNNNYNNNDNDNSNVVTNIIIRVSSTTLVTIVFACFVYCAL